MATKPVFILQRAGEVMDEAAEFLVEAGMDLTTTEGTLRASMARQALREARGNQSRAAKLLGIHRNTLIRIMDGAPDLRAQFPRQKRPPARALRD